MTINIIPRADWKARAPRRRGIIHDLPTEEVWLHHSAGNHRGAAGVRSIQAFHMDVRGWSDVAYSFLLDRHDRTVYEGRGAGVIGGHTFGRNYVSHGICVMGDYTTEPVDDDLIDFIAEFVAHGHTQGWWPRQLTGGHRDVRNTACPGDNLYENLIDINDRAHLLLTGDTMADDYTRRIQQAAANTGYSITPNGTPDAATAKAVENMAEGIQNLIRDKADLREAHTAAQTAYDLANAGMAAATTRAEAAEAKITGIREIIDQL